MARPPPGPGTPTGGSNSPRPSGNGGNSQMTINTILHNLPNLFGMHARGDLTELQVNQLRQLMHTHYKHVTASALSNGRPNPLLSLPPGIDPTMSWKGKPPLISREAYLASIEKTTAHLQEHMVKRAQEQAALAAAGISNGTIGESSQQAQAGTSMNSNMLQQPSGPGTPPIPMPMQQQTGVAGQQQHQAVVGPPQLVAGLGPVSQGQLPPGVFSLNHLKDLVKASPEMRQEWFAKDPNRVAAYNLSIKYWGAKQQQLGNAGSSGVPVAGSSRSTPPPPPPPQVQALNASTATGSPTVGRYNASLTMPTTINPSTLQTPPITPPVPPAPVSAQTQAQATPMPPSTQSPSQADRPSSTRAVELPADGVPGTTEAAVNTSSSALPAPTTTAPTSQISQPEVAEESAKSGPITGNVALDTELPSQSVEPTAAKASTTGSEMQEKSTVASTAAPEEDEKKKVDAEKGSTNKATEDTAPVAAAAPGINGDPALPSAVANTESTPAFATALPDPNAFALKPPPPPPEPEHIRRKRKWREFVDEMVPGMEMEVGIDQVLEDLLDGLLDEGFKGAVRLAKHRGSDKVELKDMAYFVDQHWNISVPGFDALGHTHRHIHVAPERERRRGKAVNPNQAAYAAFVKANGGKSQAPPPSAAAASAPVQVVTQGTASNHAPAPVQNQAQGGGQGQE
ncbi:hypothetical protein I316_04193 [Kwoniella heveanensis BCC8398]|uniref:Transcription initiation factor TFIID subunit 12 domain-containing protein n=1 Tax=Kwoniella heveanensis BCC8398 TaxID=1296120 RepID=A0A1B9GT49_9TREE|nr:hypothetical protein I316_04193 [Kwoniella heveanensis BCC8398]